MRRGDHVLAVLAAAKGDNHSPVQVQKLLFLVDQEIKHLVEGPHFNFIPYDYGPFDREVYEELEQLSEKGLVGIHPEKSWKIYRLSPKGQKLGDELLAKLPDDARKYIERASSFVRSLSFTQLVAAIYKAYPEMRENSVFQ